MLEFHRVDTSGIVDSAVVWLHGLGADGHDFESVVEELGIPHTLGVRFIFPHAPVQPVTINGGMRMRAWYDIASPDLAAQLDIPGMERSSGLVEELIRQQIQMGIPAARIILAGFSQGGLIALHLGLRFPESLAGILALSTYDPTIVPAEGPTSLPNAQTPIFFGHGSYDPVVPLRLGQQAVELLRKRGNPVEFKTYPMPHSVCQEEIQDIGHWLRNRLETHG